jgi:hypothetical protein
VGSLTGAILGLAGASSTASGITSSVFGAAKQSTDTLSTNYIVAVDLSTTSAALNAYRALYAQEIEQSRGSWNYYTARRVIMSYDNTCSQLFVRRFVNIRVNGAKTTDGTQNLIDSAIGDFIGSAGGPSGKYFKVPINASDLVNIYAYLYIQGAPKAIIDEIGTELNDQLFKDGSMQFFENITAKDLLQGIVGANLDGELKSRAIARIEQVRGILAATATQKLAALQAAATKREQTAAAEAAAAALADKAATDATKLRAAADKADEAASALRGDATKTPPPSDPILVAAQTADLKAAQSESTAATLIANHASAASLLKLASDDYDAAVKDAATATVAAAGATGAVSSSDPDVFAASATVPVGPTGLPLDSPPDP